MNGNLTKKKYRNRPHVHEKMFIIAHLGNVKQNHNEVPLIPCIMAKTEETENPKCKLGCKKNFKS